MVIDESFLDELLKQANNNDRKRQAYLLHTSFESPSQRMLNAMLPGTEVPIHRHTIKDETYTILRGVVKVFFYNDDRKIIDEIILSQTIGNHILIIPKGQWHTVEILEPSVIYEVCDGPYTPLKQEDIL